MAIYHFSVTVLSRARGHRIVAAAAAQAAARLRDDYYGILHNHTHRPGVDFTEILAPEGAPRWAFDREQLWNRVEAAERRKDAQLARAVEISLPVELEHEERIALLRDFLRAEFVARGMIADASIRRTRLDNPNAHVLLTLRTTTAAGFGPKARHWNGKGNLLNWRASWAALANLHLARAGHAMRIDHRTLDQQQIELTPSRKTGVGHPLRDLEALPEHLQARFAEQRDIAQTNGAAIIEDPAIAIRALAHQRRTFTRDQMSQFLRPRTDGDAQHGAALSAIMACSELVALNATDDHPAEYTSRDLIEAEKSLMRRALKLASRRRSGARLDAPRLHAARLHAARLHAARLHAARMHAAHFGTEGTKPSSDAHVPEAWPPPLRAALSHVVATGDFKAIGVLEEAHPEFLTAVRAYWQNQGRRVFEGAVPPDSKELSEEDVLVVAGAEMIDLKSLESILAAAERARAKLVLLADAAQLQAMGARSALHALMRVGISTAET